MDTETVNSNHSRTIIQYISNSKAVMIKNEVHESEIKTYIPVSDTSETLKSAISLGNQVKQDIDVAI